MAKKKLGEILEQMGAIDPLQLQSALGHQQQWGVPLGKAVVDKGFCSRDDVLRALSIQTGHPAISLDNEALDPRLASVLPVRTAERLRVIPLRLEGKRKEALVIAAAAPASLETIDNVQSVSGKQRVVVHVAMDDEIERAIGRLYYGKKFDAPPPPKVEALNAPAIANEAEIEFSDDAAPKKLARAVRLFGWHEASMRALKTMIERAGVSAEAIEDEALLGLAADDILVASTLGLQTALAAGQRVPAKLIICGVRDDLDVADAKALGARVYLRPPFSTEQLQGAIARCTQ